MASILPPPNSARLAITSLCNVLQHYGVKAAEPETIRQAKFDGPVVGPMWRILHDTVLVVLAGCPTSPASHDALSRLWRQLDLELADELGPDDFPREGAALVLRQLAVWGAPADLLHDMRVPGATLTDPSGSSSNTSSSSPRQERARSRPLLLALGWLVAATGLFERRVGELEPGPPLQELLPPYPQDTCANPAVQAAYDNAAQEAREHVRRLPSNSAAASASGSRAASAGGPRGRPPAPAPAGDPFGPSPAARAAEAVWVDVEAAAQRAVMLCGRVRARMVALQAALDCRHRLSHSLWIRQSAASPSSRPLTPYELQLCAQPALVQRHMTALETATLALVEQQELAAHGALFFEWMGSVIQEEQQNRRHNSTAAGGAAGRGKPGAPPGGGGGGGGGPLSSLEQLPYIGSEAGSRLMSHLQTQLEAAAQAAAPELAAARKRLSAALEVAAASAAPGAPRGPTPGHPALTMQHFLSLAERAVPEPYVGGGGGGATSAGGLDATTSDGGDQQHPVGPFSSLTSDSGASGGGGGGVAAVYDATASPPWRLPDDVAAALNAVHEAQRRQRCTADTDAERFRQMRYAALLRHDFFAGTPPSSSLGGPGGGAGAGGGPLSSVLAAAAAGAGGGGSTAAGGPGVAAGEETQRLLAAVLAAARPLARTRAANKAALLAAVQDLPEGYLVAGI